MAPVSTHRKTVVGSIAAVLLAGLVWVGCQPEQPSVTGPSQSWELLQDQLAPAVSVQVRHTDRLLAMPGVVGTAVGLTAEGRPAIRVFVEDESVTGLPGSLEGYPVERKVTGKFYAIALVQGPPCGTPPCGGGNGGGDDDDGGSDDTDPTSRHDRPVPIGISTGNEGECSAGTIGARVSGGSVYALSNNHVYALENNAPIGSDVLQPGRYDTNCNIDPNDVIGQLADYVALDFNGGDNEVDAAIASTTTDNLGTSTPSDGYGTPSSATVGAFVGQAVQKYGRTTSLTTGQVTSINATVNVGYSSGTAKFVNQIIVGSNKPFIKAGDSGSLLVDNANAPVGLLFAGDRSGKTAVANEIDAVLTAFGVAVDGS